MVDFVHDVRHDGAGWSNRPRLTCFSKDCPAEGRAWGDTLVCQPYMTQEVWDAKVAEFMARHPATVLICADRGGPVMTYDAIANSFTRVAS